MMIRYMRPLSLLLIGVALLLLAAAPAAGLIGLTDLRLPDRAVTIVNIGPDPVDLTGWTLTDERTADTYTFPSFTLASVKFVTVHPGRGPNSATDLFWNGGPANAAAWNSDGDVVTLRDAAGTRIADSRGFVLGAPTLVRTPVTTLPLVTAVALPGYTGISPIPTPYITTPPAGAAPYGPYGPIVPPYPTYPMTIRTLAPGQTTLPTVPIPYRQPPMIPLPTTTRHSVLLPGVAPVSPMAPGPTPPVAKLLPGGRRYGIGNPGSLLGTRFGMNGSTAPTGTVRTIPTTDMVPRPGSISFGIAPPEGQFVRWYPAERWVADLR